MYAIRSYYELGATLPWDSPAGLRKAMVAAVPHLAQVDKVVDNGWTALELRAPGKADRQPVGGLERSTQAAHQPSFPGRFGPARTPTGTQ